MLYQAQHLFDAQMVLNLMEQEGLRGWIEGAALIGAAGELPVHDVVRVVVHDADYEHARALVDAWEAGGIEDGGIEWYEPSEGVERIDSDAQRVEDSAESVSRTWWQRLLYPIRYVFALLWASIGEWQHDDCMRYGASLSYYTVASLAPLLIILVAVLGYFFGESATQQHLVTESARLAGPRISEMVAAVLASASQPELGTWASIVALGIVLVASTAVLVELQAALDLIWVIPRNTKNDYHVLRKAWSVVSTRFVSLLVLLVIGFVMMGVTLASAYVKIVQQWLSQVHTGSLELAGLVSPTFSVVIITLLFTILLMGLPSQRLRWRAVLPGALVAALLFMLGKSVISSYLSGAPMVSVYGAAGSLVAFMAWVYYSSQSLLFGAELAWVISMTPKGELPGSPAYRAAVFEARRTHLHAQADAYGYSAQRELAEAIGTKESEQAGK